MKFKKTLSAVLSTSLILGASIPANAKSEESSTQNLTKSTRKAAIATGIISPLIVGPACCISTMVEASIILGVATIVEMIQAENHMVEAWRRHEREEGQEEQILEYRSRRPTRLGEIPEGTMIPGQEVCSICYDEDNHMREGSPDTKVLPCGHAFHKHCLETWFGTDYNNTCPICRRAY